MRQWSYICRECGRKSVSINRNRKFCRVCEKIEWKNECVKCGGEFVINGVSEKQCLKCLGVSLSKYEGLKWKVKKWPVTPLEFERDIRILKVKKDSGKLDNFDYLMVCNIWMTCVGDEEKWSMRSVSVQVSKMIDELWLSLKVFK